MKGRTACPRCDGALTYRETQVGKRVKCPRCGQRLRLPRHPGAPAEAVDEAAEAAAEAAAADLLELIQSAHCQKCFQAAPTRHVAFHCYTVAWLTDDPNNYRSIEGNLCRRCANETFAEYTAKTFFLGPWGIVSVFVAVSVLTLNLGNYVRCFFLPYRPGETTTASGQAAFALLLAVLPFAALLAGLGAVVVAFVTRP